METQINTETVNKKIKLDFKDSKYATGRRKKSIAKVWVKKGSGNIYVNGKKMNEYFHKANLQTAIFNESFIFLIIPVIILKRYCNEELSFRKLKASSCFSTSVFFTFNYS